MPVWTVGRAAGSPFQLDAEIRYPMEVIRYPFKKKNENVSVYDAFLDARGTAGGAHRCGGAVSFIYTLYASLK